MKFPYLTLQSTTPFGKTTIDKVPILKIEFKDFYLNCIIDTGACVSMMPAEFGVAVGLFGNWIKWIILCIITIGIYSFWLGIALEKWKVKNTYFA